MTRSRGAPRGRLRINTSNGFGIHQLAPALPDFIARYPDIEIDLSITDRIVDISVDPADVIIRAGPVGDVAALSFKIADFERVVCASPDYLVRQGTPRTPADLANHTCIVIASQIGRGWPFRTADGIIHVELTRRLAVDNSEAALRLALNGGGIIRLGDIVVAEQIANGAARAAAERCPLCRTLASCRHFISRGGIGCQKCGCFSISSQERFASTPWRVDEVEAC